MPRPDWLTEELLDAMAIIESQNNPMAVGDRGLKHPAYGAYQMRQPAYEDTVQSYPEYADIPLDKTLGNAARQRDLARAFLQVLSDRYDMDTFEEAMMAYNAGAKRVREGRPPASAKAYLQKVNQQMQRR